jgi:hypothetical protein
MTLVTTETMLTVLLDEVPIVPEDTYNATAHWFSCSYRTYSFQYYTEGMQRFFKDLATLTHSQLFDLTPEHRTALKQLSTQGLELIACLKEIKFQSRTGMPFRLVPNGKIELSANTIIGNCNVYLRTLRLALHSGHAEVTFGIMLEASIQLQDQLQPQTIDKVSGILNCVWATISIAMEMVAIGFLVTTAATVIAPVTSLLLMLSVAALLMSTKELVAGWHLFKGNTSRKMGGFFDHANHQTTQDALADLQEQVDMQLQTRWA